MFTKSLSIIVVMFTMLLLATACNSTNDSNEDATANPNESTTSDDAVSENDVKNIALPDAVLQKKDEGENIRSLQETLNKIGYDVTVSGIYDEATAWAITDFQLQNGKLYATGVYNKETKSAMEKLLDSKEMIDPGAGLTWNAENATNKEKTFITNPYDQLVLVNKKNQLPRDFIPADLVVPNVRFPFTEELPKKQMRQVAADALEKLFNAADNDGVDLFAQSGYRSYERQNALFAAYASQNGEDAANKFSARPGESEHQTGLSMDVTSPDIGYQIIVDFAQTDEGKWIQRHATEYGFIIRYPKEKEDITQYQYEPWHLRYVGVKVAKKIAGQGITLEEYLDDR